MIRKFKVSNFKGFNNEFELDFTKVNDYKFNTECIDIEHKIVNTSIIYGHNGVGKSNLGLAMFDIIEHLTDKRKKPELYNNYLCAYNTEDYATFYYEFSINSQIVSYEYKKTDYKTIIYEKLSIDQSVVAYFDRTITNKAEFNLKGTESLKQEINNNELSVLKYIKNNSVLEDNNENKTFNDFFCFIDSILFFRNLDNRTYMGLQNGTRLLLEDIVEKNLVGDFEVFLNESGVKCKLEVVEGNESKTIGFKLGEKVLNFNEVASTGTSSITLFYYWYQRIKEQKVKFLFIDEFDAFYHHTLSFSIVNLLKKSKVQCVLTSHNISNLTNDLLRPDCYFLMYSDKIGSLSNSTDKELREAHNIEKMYKAGSFYVK